MESKARFKKLKTPRSGKILSMLNETYNFEGYDAETLMRDTAKLRRLITKRGTFGILITLCCRTDPVRYIKLEVL